MNVYTCSRIELKRVAIETAVMYTLNSNPTMPHRLFDCGDLGIVRIWWGGSSWQTRWHDDIISVTEMPEIMSYACKMYGRWKKQRAWMRRWALANEKEHDEYQMPAV